jgi:nitrogen regulatory protein PII
MKIIWAVIPPGYTEDVITALRKAGIRAVTCIDVSGSFGNLPVMAGAPDQDYGGFTDSSLLMTAVADYDVPKVVSAIRNVAKARKDSASGPDNPQYGKIFVSYVDDYFNVRKDRKGSRKGTA